MKLYTEEELRQAFAISDFYGLTNGILEKCTPIELPSNEEIKKTMMDFDEFDPYDVSYLGGAIWMRDKIQGGEQ